VDRVEAAIGFRFTREVRGRLGAQRTHRRPFAAAPVDHDLLAASLTLAFAMPAGHDARDYPERTLMADAELARGPLELRAEGIHRRWATVHTGELAADAGYVEARWAITGGAWVAVRAEAMRFSDVVTSANVTRPWDDDVDRVEAAIGFRFTREVRGRLGAQRTHRRPFAAAPVDHDLLAASLTLAFSPSRSDAEPAWSLPAGSAILGA